MPYRLHRQGSDAGARATSQDAAVDLFCQLLDSLSPRLVSMTERGLVNVLFAVAKVGEAVPQAVQRDLMPRRAFIVEATTR